MFTGLIEAIGTLRRASERGARLTIACEPFDEPLVLGESIAVNGVCLTAIACDDAGFAVDISAETLACTTMGTLKPGARLNLERALKLGARLGGHWVTGHVDGIGEVITCDTAGDNRVLGVRIERKLAQYIPQKGAVTLNGVSLTVNEAHGARFTVNLVPHTLAVTNLKHLKTGDRVNLEVDMIARYLQHLLTGGDQTRS